MKQKVDVKVTSKNATEGLEKSSEDKIKEQNRISQLAKTAREKMPKDYRSFCMVAAHLVKNAHHYYDSNAEEVKQVKVEDKEADLKSLEEDIKKFEMAIDPEDKCKLVNQKLRCIRNLKRQN